MNNQFITYLQNRFHFFNNTYFEIEDGWFEIIKDMALELNDVVDKNFKIFEIKQKYGSMRITTFSDYNKQAEDICNKYEIKSQDICEFCGIYGEQKTCNNWVYCICSHCENKIRRL